MKQLATLFLVLFILHTSVQAQDCSEGRYSQDLFAVKKLTNVEYGTAINIEGNTEHLYMDIYSPLGDLAEKKALVIMIHGGSFLDGDKGDDAVVKMCEKFAKTGYVAAAINYRLGFTVNPLDPTNKQITQTILRAMQDTKGAIRFLKSDARNSNAYQVDTNFIVVAGTSAGAITALYAAYLDSDEVPYGIDINTMGGMEGKSGYANYTGKFHAVVDMCGALDNANWIEAGDIPIVSMHGNADNIVPYETGPFFSLINMEVDGSATLYARAQAVGVSSELKTFYGKGHTPYNAVLNPIDGNAYMDTAQTVAITFLASKACVATSASTIKQQAIPQPALLIPYGGRENLWIIALDENSSELSLQVLNINGQLIYASETKNGDILSLQNVPQGIYVARFTNSQGYTHTYKILRQ